MSRTWFLAQLTESHCLIRSSVRFTSGLNQMAIQPVSLRSLRLTCHTLRFNVAFCRVRQVRASRRSHTIYLKQLVNFAVSKVNQREWSAGGTWQV